MTDIVTGVRPGIRLPGQVTVGMKWTRAATLGRQIDGLGIQNFPWTAAQCVLSVAGDEGAAVASGMDFVGRDDPVRKLTGWLNGEGWRSPVSIVSVSGPGGIGKTFLLEHAMRLAGLERRNYLRLRVSGVTDARTLGQIVCQDLLQSCSQVDVTGNGYFTETRKNLEALRFIDAQARMEVEAQVSGNPWTSLTQSSARIERESLCTSSD